MHVASNVPSPATGLSYLPGKLPTCEIPADTDYEAVAQALVARLPYVDTTFFTEDCLWRDQLTLTETFRTIYGGERARSTWLYLAAKHKPSKFVHTEHSAHVVELGNNNRFIFSAFTFETNHVDRLPGVHTGFLNFVPGPNGPDTWQVWSMQTLLEAYKGHEMVDLRRVYPDPERDVFPKSEVGLSVCKHYKVTTGYPASESTGMDGVGAKNRLVGHDGNPRRLDAIIVGAGQGGLSTAGYLKSLGMEIVCIERNARIGDNWVRRYAGLQLHTPHRFNDLPFGPTFNDDEYSQWVTAKEIAKAYQYYVDRYDINVMLSTNVTSCSFDKIAMQWTVEVDQMGHRTTLNAAHLVLAIGGGGGTPLKPHHPGEENYTGTVMHSANYSDGEAWRGKNGIVIGSANTAHDVAENMLSSGLKSVTMIQRGTTYVLPRDFMTGFLGFCWPPPSVRSSDVSDRLFFAPPTAVARLMTYNYLNPKFDAAMKFFDDLEEAGFRSDRRGDFTDHLLVRFGGHFVDHGASAKIIKGQIKVKGDSAIAGFTPQGLEFVDGTKLDADVIVFATGFEKDLTIAAASIVGQDIAGQLEEFWGVDEEGEMKGAYKPCGFPNLWMMGGGCAHARYFSRIVALQIQAAQLGHPIQPFTETKLETRST